MTISMQDLQKPVISKKAKQAVFLRKSKRNKSEVVYKKIAFNNYFSIKDLNYNQIYKLALEVFAKSKFLVNLNKTLLRTIGIEDTKSLYIMNYIFYINGDSFYHCLKFLKQTAASEILHFYQKRLTDVYEAPKGRIIDSLEDVNNRASSLGVEGRDLLVVRKLLEGYSYGEIGREMNIGAQAVKQVYEKIVRRWIEKSECYATSKSIRSLMKSFNNLKVNIR